jgi:asparagine synthetase B (glutamine-hydrolysing)
MFFSESDYNEIDIKKEIEEEFGIEVKHSSFKWEDGEFLWAGSKEDELSFIKCGDLLIVGDIELHNKIDLVHKYQLRSSISVLNLISILYRANGIDFVKELVGEFSFIIYDTGSRIGYAIRDHLGVKTLFWIKGKDGYILANDMFLLKRFFNVQNININYFFDFVKYDGIVDGEITPYVEVHRVSSGCYIRFNNDFSEKKLYWDLSDLNDEVEFKNVDDYIDEFKSIFFKAVESRLQTSSENTIMLSGGLDSTSIYAASKIICSDKNNKNRMISSVSAVFDELKECDESSFICKLLDKYNDKGNFKRFDSQLMYNNFPRGIPFSYEPHTSALTFEFTFILVNEAAKAGSRNVLTGYAGDQLLTGSLYVTRDLLRRGEIKRVLNYITNYSVATNTSAFNNFLDYTIFPKKLTNQIGFEKSKKIKYSHQKYLYLQMNNSKAHLFMDRTIGGLTGVNLMHPFLDRRLVEFIYRIPGEFTFSLYQNKFILRRALRDLLTEDIANRLNKTTHLAYTYKSIRENWGDIYQSLCQPKMITELDLVTEVKWQEMLTEWRNGKAVSDNFWVLLTIELWKTLYDYKFSN